METTSTKTSYPFLQGGGEMGALTRTYDWSTTPIGVPEQWPQSLRTTLSILLNSKFPMFLFWGPDLLCFYNDAYRPSLGNDGKHPGALGQPGADVWPEIWPVIKPLIDQVLAGGEATWSEDQLIPIYRNGTLEDVYWTFSYSPVSDETGHPAGVFVTCTETTEKVNTIRNLQVSEQRFQNLVRDASVGVIVLGGDEMRVDVVNEAYARLVGRRVDELRHHRVFDLIPEAEAVFRPIVEGVRTSGESLYLYGQPYQVYSADGTAIDGFLDLVYQPYKEQDGTVTGVMVLCQDVTEQVLARKTIEEAGAYSRQLTDTVPAMIWTTDPDGYCTYLNQQWYAYTGQTQAEAEGYGWLDATHPDDKAESAERFIEANRKQIPFSLQYRLRAQDGTYRWAIDRGSPRFGPTGDYLGMIGTVVDVHEQKLAEEALRASEQRFQAAVAAVQGILWTNNAAGEMEGQQVGWAALTGQTYDEYQGYGWSKAVHPDDAQPTIDAWNAALRQRSTFVFEHRVRVQEGHWDLFSIRAIPLLNPDGSIREWVGVHTNITRQRQAEEALRTSEAKLRSVVETAPVAIGLFMGRDLVVELPNQTFIDIVGKGPDITGKPLREVMPELLTENQPFLQILDDVYTSGRPFHSYGSMVQIVQQGVMTHNYYNITYTPLFNEAGEVYAILDIAVDVTGQVLTQQRLEAAETALRGAIELAELATWSLDIERGTISYSPRFMDWLGFSEDTKGLDEAYNPLPDEYRQSVADALTATWQPGGSGFYENEHPIINRRTGQVRIIHAQAQVFYSADEKPLTLSGTAQDVTEQRQMQLALEQQVRERTEALTVSNRALEETNVLLTRSNENLQRFAYVASHDLQEPLRKIMSFGDRLRIRHGAELGSGLDYVERMQAAANRMSTLITDLLTFSRVSTHTENTVAVPLTQVVDQVLIDLDLLIQETGAVARSEPLPTIQGDQTQLGQLFQNLLTNALKFRRPDVPLIIDLRSRVVNATELPDSVKPTRQVSSFYRIDVADNGIGFEQKYVDRIFEVFQRLHGRSEYSGTGIGLAICEKVAANHGGAITATSQPGEGATFSVYFPV